MMQRDPHNLLGLASDHTDTVWLKKITDVEQHLDRMVIGWEAACGALGDAGIGSDTDAAKMGVKSFTHWWLFIISLCLKGKQLKP